MLYLKLLALVPAIALAFLVSPQLAEASTFSLSPASGNIGVGSTLSVQLKVNTQGEQINTVAAYLSYPADKLDVAWVSYNGSAFTIAAPSSSGGGIIKIERGHTGPVSGNVNVATIGFRGKAQGDARVSFNADSGAYRYSDAGNTFNLGGSGAANFKVVAASAGSTSVTPAVGQTKTAPVISELKVSSVATDSATITWKTDKKADSYIEYGQEAGKYILSESSATQVTDHSITLSGKYFQSGAKYHFRVKSKDAAGEAESEDQVFHLKGYNVKLRVSDNQGAPIANTEVVLHSDPRSATTDSNGEATFEDVTAGKHLVVVKLNNADKASEITISDASFDVQTIEVKVETTPTPSRQLFDPQKSIWVIGFIVVVLLVTIGLVIINKRRNRPPSASEVHAPVDLHGPQAENKNPAGPQVFISDN